MTMRTTHTLIIAAAAALSITGAAMAQEADYQNLWNGGLAPKASQLANAANVAPSGRSSLVTMFGSQSRSHLDLQPVYDGADGGAAN
jgi:hypothetical protein